MLARDYFKDWLSQQRLFLQRSTYEALEVYFGKHIIPYFYDRELEEIKPSDIQAYVNYKLSSVGRADGSGIALNRFGSSSTSSIGAYMRRFLDTQ